MTRLSFPGLLLAGLFSSFLTQDLFALSPDAKNADTITNSFTGDNFQLVFADTTKPSVPGSMVHHIQDSIFSAHIRKNPGSLSSIFLLGKLSDHVPVEEKEKLFNILHDTLRQSGAGLALLKKFAFEKLTAIGQPAPLFTATNAEGEPVSLASFRGSYVLLDFWASWCGPCRKENPALVSAFRKYGSDRFSIIGISLDSGKEKWQQAILEDSLTWTQVADMQGWSNAVAQQYGIRSIPASFLLDPDGIIIARNLRGAELEQKLAELFPE